MNLPQIILVIVIISLSTLLTVIGIQIIGLLKETKKTLKKVDNILEDAEFLTHNITTASSSLNHVSEGLKSGIKIVSLVSDFIKNRKSEQNQDID